jgi:hypothetical protein
MTVAFAGCPGTAPFGPVAPADAAAPVFVSLTDSGGADGRAEPGDVLEVRFSEPLAPTWGPSVTVAVTLKRHGNNQAELSIPFLVSGTTFGTGSPGYVARNATVTFPDSTLTVDGAVLRLTLGQACSGCAGAGAGQGSFSFTPAGTIRDPSGYVSIAPIARTGHRLF